jgi:hypothetical protein
MRTILAVCCFAVYAAGQGKLAVAARVDHIDERAKEPMVVEHPNGTLFVAGYGKPFGVRLWKSTDHGAAWTRVNKGSETDGAVGTSDVDLAISRDGTLYFAALDVDQEARVGRGVSIGVSNDTGSTWRWTRLSSQHTADRPWVAVAADGTAHVIWSEAAGVNYAVSRDHGGTWTQRPLIYEHGGSSHLAVGPRQEVAVRVTPLSGGGTKFDPGVDLIAVSTDGGATWKTRPAPGNREWSASFSATKRWVEPLAWDSKGALYSFWADGKELWLARSIDKGETWASWKVDSGDDIAYYPYLVARGRGELAATWFSGDGEATLSHIAKIDASGSAAPKLVEGPSFHPETWRPGAKPEDSPIRDAHAGGEYMPITFLKAGGFAVVSSIIDLKAQRFGFTWWRLESR